MTGTPPPRLFVYGTLLQGQPQAGLLGRLPRAPAAVRGALYRFPQGYPGLIPDPFGAWVEGELIELGDEIRRLLMLDLYEGVGEGLFQRERLPVRRTLRMWEAWAYTVTPEQVRRRGAARLAVSSWREVSPGTKPAN